ncbi:MAG TPA: hypothetical protein VNT75_29625 [Symbiobacteriaceae bacterium]|nr:hypothetical protein [Symbiobacteriaceae bacterium]
MHRPYICRRVSALLAVLAALFLWVPPAGAALAPTPELLRLSLPASAQAGTTLHVTAVAQEPENGVESGQLTLKGPSDQRLTGILVRQPRSDNLVLDLPLPAQLEPGRWVVAELIIYSNASSAFLRLVDGQALAQGTFSHSVQITAAGPVDLSPAVVQDVALQPSPVVEGGKVTVSLGLSDPPSGTASVTAYLSDTRPDATSTWIQAVPLRLNPANGRWEGAAYAPIFPAGAESAAVWVRSVVTRTGAGVEQWSWCGPFSNPLPETCTFPVVRASVPPTLITSPVLALFHPGRPDFFAWHDQDAAYVRSLFTRVDAAPETVRLLLAAQLPALSAALGAVRSEIYRDPESGIQIAVPNTTGKYLALRAAVRGRLLLWGELERRAGGPGETVLTLADLDRSLRLLDEDEIKPAPPAVYDGGGPLLAQGYIEAIKASRLPPGLWNLPQAIDRDPLTAISLLRNVHWLFPFASDAFLGLHDDAEVGGIGMILPETLPAAIWPDVIVHELGHHFHDVFLSGVEADRSDRWQEYLRIRGGQEWYTEAQIGHNGHPWENLAEDFSKVFQAPDVHVDDSDPYQYPLLTDGADDTAAFRQFILDLAAQEPPTPLDVNWPHDGLAVALPGSRILSGWWEPAQNVSVAVAPLQVEHLTGQEGFATTLRTQTANKAGFWQSVLLADPGAIQAVSVYGNHGAKTPYRRHFYLYRSGLLLDAVPFQVASETVTLSGRTVAGAQVTANGQALTVSAGGTFSGTVPLQEGLNRILLVAKLPDGTTHSALAEVDRIAVR